MCFRFFFIYFILSTAIWGWFYNIPVLNYITQAFDFLTDKLVRVTNRYLLHIKEELEPLNGSGDTSFGWAQFYTFLLIAALGCTLWSIIDRKRIHYSRLQYWLKILLRATIIVASMSYGIIKLFGMQMPFPLLSHLVTPLGDFLPMRLSWMFIGYSYPYQFFSGVMEILVGLLLLNRRTITFGALLGMAVFAHVFILNMSYDIPVKIYSFQLFVCCVYLVGCDLKRIINFLILNKTAERDASYDLTYNRKWQKWARLILKSAFVFLFVLLPFYQIYQLYKIDHSPEALAPMIPGWYEVADYVVHGDTLTENDTLRWKDVIFDGVHQGSIKGHHADFRKRYGREYFNYNVDTLKKEFNIVKSFWDTTSLMQFHYEIPDTTQMILWSMADTDTLRMRLVRKNHHFQLTEKQFHWLSEQNR